MPKPRPLSGAQAKRSLAHRLGARADRLRQFNTRFGIRPYRVFLVWTRYGGQERGEGAERLVARVELLPTPKVVDLSSIALTGMAAGVIGIGTLRVSEISTCYTQDTLAGKFIPEYHEDRIPEPFDFCYEVVEDGRGDPLPVRGKYRLAAVPFRDAAKLQWTVLLERVAEDNHRDGSSRIGDD